MTAGCSGASQTRKLGIKPGHRVLLASPPPGWRLTDPPDGLVYVGPSDPADVVVCFVATADDLATALPDLVPRIHPDGTLWVAWPRRAGGHHSDITENLVREHALPLGVDVKVAAIDRDWSGLRLVWRVSNRSRSGK